MKDDQNIFLAFIFSLYAVKSYFVGSDETRTPIDEMPIRILLRNGTWLEVRDTLCESTLTGAIMMGAAPGAFFQQNIWEALNKVGTLSLSGTTLQFDQRKHSSTGTVVNYAISGSQIWINGKQFKGRIEKNAQNQLAVFLDPNDANVIGNLNILQVLEITAKPYKMDVFVLCMVLLAAWWVIAFSLLQNGKKVYELTIVPLFNFFKSVCFRTRLWK